MAIQKRSPQKVVAPSLWDLSCAEHLEVGERKRKREREKERKREREKEKNIEIEEGGRILLFY